MFTWRKDSSGEVSATCTCGAVYYMTSEWDKANMNWHDCGKAGV